MDTACDISNFRNIFLKMEFCAFQVAYMELSSRFHEYIQEFSGKKFFNSKLPKEIFTMAVSSNTDLISLALLLTLN
jgi:hypothetical protein